MSIPGPPNLDRCVSVALAVMRWAVPCRADAAGGAYAVDDADMGKPGSCQNEAWLSGASSRDFVSVESPACVFNKSYPIEITALFQRANRVRPGHYGRTAGQGRADQHRQVGHQLGSGQRLDLRPSSFRPGLSIIAWGFPKGEKIWLTMYAGPG